MMRFLLIHGAWHGGWCWDGIAERLRAEGHEVLAPDLPGLGEDSAALSPGIGLENHIAAAMPDNPCILCAHSYGGMIARAIADRRPDRVTGIVLIEALWPDDGQSAFDLVSPERQAEFEAGIETQGEGWRMPVPDPAGFRIDDPVLRAGVAARMTDHPARTFRDPLRLTGPEPPTGTYVIATDRDPQPYAATANLLRAQDWRVEAMPGGHELMLTQPARIADLLCERTDHLERKPA